MNARTALLAGLAASGLAQPAPLAAQAAGRGVPEVVRQRINDLVSQCLRAGGSMGAMTGQGQFVIPRDFNGDGQTDFLVSEGNFPCTGQPALFRSQGRALLQLYLGGPAGATLAFEDRLLAYRVLDGVPARLQVARTGAACGSAARCGDELRWNAAARRFEEVATDGRKAGAAPLTRPATILSGVATPSTPPPSTPPPAASLPLAAGAEASFRGRCQADTRRLYPTMSAASITQACADGWQRVVAAGPVADALLAAVPAKPGERLTLPLLRARLPQVRWQAGGKAHQHAPDMAGRMAGQDGGLEVGVKGAPVARSIAIRWQAPEAPPPYDVAAALAARGAKVTALGCMHFGRSEVTRAYVVEVPGRAAFALETVTREAALGGQESWQVMQAGLDGTLPTPASLRAANRDPAWQATCPY